MNKSLKQTGAVSLFVVVFAALLITVVTVSFLRLMVHNQEQASTQDLSQSAYDSAQAGVEDAKRALLRYQTICAENKSDCDALTQTALGTGADNWMNCNKALNAVVTEANGEVQVEQTTSDESLNQAYTCVKVQLTTDDFLGSLSANQSKIIPLVGTSGVTSVEVDWYTTDDIGAGSSTGNFNVDLLLPTAPLPLQNQTTWKSNRPSVLRTQLMQFSSNGFTLSDFDNTTNDQSDANTVFLYPTGVTGAANTADPATVDFLNRDIRQTPTGTPLGVTCSGTLAGGGYACRERLTLPTPINAGDRTAYLRLTPLYNASHFSVSLLDDQNRIVQFNGVQPSIDSTGRANDLFRRVETRVELIDTTFAYPDNAVDVSGNFCKDFAVTNVTSDYKANAVCTP